MATWKTAGIIVMGLVAAAAMIGAAALANEAILWLAEVARG